MKLIALDNYFSSFCENKLSVCYKHLKILLLFSELMDSSKIDIKLTKEEKELCDASPIEIFLYYLYYPKLLLRDAKDSYLNPYNLLVNSWIAANKYWYNKNRE